MIRKSMPSGLTRGWVPVFPRDKREAFARRSCSNKKIERDDDSKKSHPALAQPRLTCRRESMSEAYSRGSASGAIRHESGYAAALGAADWLCLAAAPTFAIMALLTGVLGGGPPDTLCSAASPLNGMVPMYLLMSAFHCPPWLKLISSRGSGARRAWIASH